MITARRNRSALHLVGSTACLAALLAFAFHVSVAHAATAEDAADKKRAALLGLAAQFSQKVGTTLEDTNAALTNTGNGILTPKKRAAFEGLADGEMLLLSTTLREARSLTATKYEVTEPITAIKQGYDAYISLSDLSYIAGFPIKIDPEKNIAEGTFFSESNPFRLDVNAGTVMLGDVSETVRPDDIIAENDDFFIRSAVLGKWFDFSVDLNPASQKLVMITSRQLPVQGRIERQKKRNTKNTRAKPEKERLPEEYHAFTLPRADVLLTQQWEKPGDNRQADTYTRYNVSASNQLLNHEMTSFISGSIAESRIERHPVSQARFNFKKESEFNDLLGPLQAKVYELNDLTPTSVPLTSGTGTERGVRVSNQSSRYSVDTETQIDGEGQPGWDVELFRNNSFVAGVTVDETGRYNFEKVTLFAGDNKFRIIQYGPEGERREEERIVTVLPNLVGDIKGYYNASLTQKDTITYQANPIDNEDTGTMRFAGVYDRRVTDNLTLRGGLHTRETGGQRDNYFYSGAVTSLGEAIINADMVTTSDGPFRATVTGRQQLGRHNAVAGLDYSSADFSDYAIDDSTTAPQQQGAYLRFQGPFMTDTFSNVSYDTLQRVSQNEDGRLSTVNNFGLTSRFMGLMFNNNISHTTDNQSTAGRERVIDYSGSVRGYSYGYSWRGLLDYEISPLAEPTRAAFNVTRNFDSRLSGFADLDHQFRSEITTGTTGLSYYADKFRVSPQISYDSESNLQAKVNVNFSVAKDPYSNNVLLSAYPLGSKGGLSVFAFLDANANGLQDEGEEPLEDVSIFARQYNATLITDKNGYAFKGDLPTGKVSDVVMEESSAFDPTWVAGYDGAAVRLRPSEVIRLDFPVLRGAEIDGTAYNALNDGSTSPARSIDVVIYDTDGKVVKQTTTPYDGFYYIEALRPGVYYLTTNSSMAPYRSYRVPEKLVITPEGGQLYGKNITLTRGYDIRFTFTAANANPALQRRTKITKPEDIAREDVYLRLGNYRSSIAASLAWYKFKLRTRGWSNPFTPVAKDFDSVARDEKTGRLPLVLKSAQPIRMEDAAVLCERLVDAGFSDCGVDVVTTYHNGEDSAAATPPVKG